MPPVAERGYGFRPARADDVRWIAELEERVYGPHAVPYALLRDWFEASPGGFVLVVDGAGRRVGNINLLPLRPQGVATLTRAGATERDLSAGDLHSPGEREAVRSVYVESLAADVGEAHARGRVLAAILCNLDTLSARVADLSRLETLYAVAATAEGERVVRRLGFRVAGQAGARGDGQALFEAAALATFERVRSFCSRVRR